MKYMYEYNDHFAGMYKHHTEMTDTVECFIFVGTNFRGLSKNYTFVGFKILGHSIFSQNSYRKSLFRGY